MNRYAVRIGSLAAFAMSALLIPANAQAAGQAYAYQGRQFVFQTLPRPGGPAISADDPGLRALVKALGATLTWDSDNEYVLIAFPGPKLISFAVGDPHYLVDSVSQKAAYAPFLLDGHAYVPLNDVLQALKLPPLSGAPAAGVTPAASPSASPSPSSSEVPATPLPSAELAQVTSVSVQLQGDAAVVRIDATGNGSFQWHRLAAPDDRWWIDISGARLTAPPGDQLASGPIQAVRVRQQSPGTVRVALSLSAYDDVEVIPDDTGVTISVANHVAAENVPRSGTGTFGTQVTAIASPSPTAVPSRYVATNPKLIAIDPGHGGSDPGTVRGDVQEKTITLDIARRLRAILIARGWQVVMTRDTDRDVFAANASGADELQARDDIANSKGARVLVSVHVNSYVNAGPHGVTTFYYKPSDLALAQAIDRRVVTELGMKNDGVIKDKLYVVHHANMPAALIETAFISNPDDFALLQSADWRQKMALAIADGIVDFTSL